MKILSSFTHHQVVPNLYEFIFSAEYNRRYCEECNRRYYEVYNRRYYDEVDRPWGWVNDEF